MLYTKIKVNSENGEYIAEHAYPGGNPFEALRRFRKEYPELKNLPYVAEVIDGDSEYWKEWFAAARSCGCVHCF